MQGLIPTFHSIIQKLEEKEIQYMVVGSVAAMIYGEPRLTHDISGGDLKEVVNPTGQYGRFLTVC